MVVSSVSPSNGKYFTLEEMQRFVNGLIQFIYLDDLIMVINEEGKCQNLPVNTYATILFREKYKIPDVVVGNVLITPNKWIR